MSDPLDLSRDAAVDASIARAEAEIAKDFDLYHQAHRNGRIAGLREAAELCRRVLGKQCGTAITIDSHADNIERETIAKAPEFKGFGKACYEAFYNSPVMQEFQRTVTRRGPWGQLSEEFQCAWVAASQAVLDEARKAGWFR